MEIFRKAIETNEAILSRNLDVENGLWTELQARGILTEVQLANCKKQVSYSFVLAFGNRKECFVLALITHSHGSARVL